MPTPRKKTLAFATRSIATRPGERERTASTLPTLDRVSTQRLVFTRPNVTHPVEFSIGPIFFTISATTAVVIVN